jgi:hypothetical protein
MSDSGARIDSPRTVERTITSYVPTPPRTLSRETSRPIPPMTATRRRMGPGPSGWKSGPAGADGGEPSAARPTDAAPLESAKATLPAAQTRAARRERHPCVDRPRRSRPAVIRRGPS